MDASSKVLRFLFFHEEGSNRDYQMFQMFLMPKIGVVSFDEIFFTICRIEKVIVKILLAKKTLTNVNDIMCIVWHGNVPF